MGGEEPMGLLWTGIAGIASSFVGLSGLAGERPSQVLLVLGAIVALGLTALPRRR
jgi:hypothetical protein